MKIVAFTGAGISRESGIKTFRDNDGLWNDFSIEEVATKDAWAKNPQKVLDFYNQRRSEIDTVSPNDAHKYLKKLEEKHDVTIITQNIDDLHERAGSSKILHPSDVIYPNKYEEFLSTSLKIEVLYVYLRPISGNKM